MIDNSKEYILCAAMRFTDEDEVTIFTGFRHCDIIRTGVVPNYCDQGFLTSHNRFVDRRLALIIAKECGQVGDKTHCENALYTEDLY